MSAFVDEAQLNVRGGDGGFGCVSFRREGPVAFGGPNGGDGGDGGSVWLVADHNVASLLAFRDHPHRKAGDGVNGMGKDLHGRRGEDLLVAVPEGATLWYDTTDISALREGEQERAATMQTLASAASTLLMAGYEAESITAAPSASEMTRLRHTGLLSVQLQPPGTQMPATNGNNDA